MLSQKDTLELLSYSPFKQFVLMELERERIYQSYAQIDELIEINQIWLSFSNFCTQSLSDVSSLANLLYKRYLDEWTRDKSQIAEEPEREKNLTFKIENLQEFQMELAILMIIYSDIVNTGIFGSKPEDGFSSTYIEGYRILNAISQTYFDSTHPRASNIEEVMLTYLLLNQKRQIINLLEESSKQVEKRKITKEKGDFELANSEFNTSFISELLKKLGKDWWWQDPIASHFVYERSLEHLTKAKKLYNKIPEDPDLKVNYITKKLIPINQALRNNKLIDHFFRLSLEAARGDKFRASVEYLNLVLALEKEALEIISQSPHITDTNFRLKEEIIKKEILHSFIHGIAELAYKSSLFQDQIASASKESVPELITEIEELANRQELQVNINHVSSLPFIYLNYVKEFKIAT
ncbi:MAG: hypothetical protein ACTSX6_13205, partial [Candidatus Heimdallarchaeaceae archaeon]